jgi:D-3-phosphoglycerate dehydrogenase / 2-oxoglutarate reductase
MSAILGAPVSEGIAARLLERYGTLHTDQVPLGSVLDRMGPAERRAVRLVVVEADPVGPGELARLEELEAIGCVRSSPVNVDLAAASQRAIPVVFTPGRNAAAVAEFTLGLCLSAVRSIAISHAAIASRLITVDPADRRPGDSGDVIWTSPSGDMRGAPYEVYQGRELSSLAVGVVGFGQVGREVAARLLPLAGQVWICDPAVPPADITAAGGRPAGLDELLGHVDLITLHAKSARQLLGAAEIRRLRRGSYLVNTARASILDYDALADALIDGHLRGAALDVFPEEPLPADSRLLSCPNLTLTPHLAGATEDVVTRHSEILWNALQRLDGDAAWAGLPVANPAVEPGYRARRARSAAR